MVAQLGMQSRGLEFAWQLCHSLAGRPQGQSLNFSEPLSLPAPKYGRFHEACHLASSSPFSASALSLLASLVVKMSRYRLCLEDMDTTRWYLCVFLLCQP